MKHLKIVPLSMAIAIALLAVGGAGTASATVLCKTSTLTTGCASGGQDYPASTTVEGNTNGGGATLESIPDNNILNDCDESTFKAKTSNTGSATETVKGQIESLTYSGCIHTEKTIKSGTIEFHHVTGGTASNGTFTIGGMEVTTEFLGVSCVYGAGTGVNAGIVVGGNPAAIEISAVLPRVSGGFLCPAEARWTTTYSVTTPKPLYVSES